MFCPTTSYSPTESVYWNLTETAAVIRAQESPLSALTEFPIREMNVGRTYYRFVRPTVVRHVLAERRWVCFMGGLTDYSAGGDAPDQAFEELKTQIHADFQILLRKRSFELSDDEHSRWVQLTSVIDLWHYRTTTPIITHDIGEVIFEKRSRPYSIKWINGERYTIDPREAPGDLMSCRHGQWIEAVTRRDPMSHAILGIESIRRISFRIPTESESDAIWHTMPEAQVEPGEWVW